MILELIFLLTVKKNKLLSSQQLVVFSENQVVKKCKHTFHSYLSG